MIRLRIRARNRCNRRLQIARERVCELRPLVSLGGAVGEADGLGSDAKGSQVATVIELEQPPAVIEDLYKSWQRLSGDLIVRELGG